jgi:hypothetical protein
VISPSREPSESEVPCKRFVAFCPVRWGAQACVAQYYARVCYWPSTHLVILADGGLLCFANATTGTVERKKGHERRRCEGNYVHVEFQLGIYGTITVRWNYRFDDSGNWYAYLARGRSSGTVVSDYKLDDLGSIPGRGKGIFLCLGPTQSPVQWVPEGGSIPRGQRAAGHDAIQCRVEERLGAL